MALKDVEGFNPLDAFLHPKKAVIAALEFPSIISAVIIILLPWILQFIALAVFSVKNPFEVVAANMALQIALFFLQAFLIFLLARKFGNRDKKLLEGVVSAFSLTQLATIVLVLFGILVVALNPQVVAIANQWNSGQILPSDLVNNSFDAIMGNVFLAIPLYLVGVVLTVWMSLLWLYIAFRTVHESTKVNAFGSVVLLVAVMVVSAAIQSLVIVSGLMPL